jgi:ABC-type multidrug transport system permease subunit
VNAPPLVTPPSQFRELYLARLRDFVREPGVLFWVFGFPVLLAVALGLAFREKGPERVPVLVVEGAEADATAAAVAASPLLAVRRVPAAGAADALRRGEGLVVVTPGTPPTLAHDPSRPGAAVAVALVTDALEDAAGRRDTVAPRVVRTDAPGRRYIDFLAPGLVGMTLMGGGIWGVGYALVSMRVRKLLKRLAATPMSRWTFLGSFLLHRVVLAAIEIGFLFAFAWAAFGVAVTGSVVALAWVGLLGTLAFGGLGLLIASRARNMETASGLMNLASLPMWLLSGVFFSTSNFPDWMQPMVKALPLTALNDGLRAVVLDGAGLASVALEAGILLAWTAVTFALALRWFRWS